MARSPFITFEGSEGCGKSTQVQRLAERLRETGIPFLVTREPGGTAIGEKIRDLLQFDPESRGMVPETELLLFEASRSQLVREIIQPALDNGMVVLSDRFVDSTSVYQGVARRLDRVMIEHLNSFAVADCRPDLTFVLDIDVETAHVRMLRRVRPTAVRDRMEEEPVAFYEDVRQAYRDLAAREPHRIVLIDARQLVEKIEEEIWTTLVARFGSLIGLTDSAQQRNHQARGV